MTRLRLTLFVVSAWTALSVLLCRAAPARAEGNCDALTQDQSARLDALLGKIHAYNGCDRTLAACLKAPHPHFSVRYAVNDVCRLVKANKSNAEIERALAKRARSLMPALKKISYLDDSRTAAGDPESPVTAVVYACARCPFCRVLVPSLYHAVTEGRLKGKVRMVFRPFPLKSHEGAVEGASAMEAAATQGRFWPMLHLLYSRYDTFCPALLPEWAEEVGIPRAAFGAAYADPRTREALITSKREGVANKVVATPTVFINGVLYDYDMSEDVMEEVLEEAYQCALEGRGKL